MSISFLLLVHLVAGGLCSTAFSHHLFIDKLYALQNRPPNSSQQILTLAILCDSLMPSKMPFSDAIADLLNFTLTDGNPTYGGHGPTRSEICPDTCQCSGKTEIWDAPNVMTALISTTAPLETQMLTCDSVISSKSKIREPATL